MLSRLLLGLVLALGVATTGLAQAPPSSPADPRTGVWKLDLEKSKFPPGAAPRMQVRQIENRPDGFNTFTLVEIDSHNVPRFIQSTYRLDGRPYPEFTQATLPAIAAGTAKPVLQTYRLLDPGSVEVTRLGGDGQPIATTVHTLSTDGRTWTSTRRDPQGRVLQVQIAVRE